MGKNAQHTPTQPAQPYQLPDQTMARHLHPQHTPPTQFYRLPHLKQKFQVAGSTIWSWVKKGTFVKPIKLSENCTVWDAAAVEDWAQARIAESQAAK
ncbi:MAG: AlpA family phage regulatory protein [Gallionella sp.]